MHKRTSYPTHVIKAYKGIRWTDPLVLNLSPRWRWVVNIKPCFKSRKEPQ